MICFSIGTHAKCYRSSLGRKGIAQGGCLCARNPGAVDGRGRGDCTAVEVGGILEEHELSTNICSPSRHTIQLHLSAIALELGREREKVGGWQGPWGGEDM